MDHLPATRDPASGSRPRPLIRRAAIEAALLGALLGVYNLTRSLIVGQEKLARDNAELVHELEAAIRLPSEAAFQAALHSETLFRAANTYYTTVHFPLMAAFLLFGFLCRPPHHYRWARNLLLIQTAGALAIHVAFPLAPPRMFPNWGFVDTMTTYGPSPYEGASAALANQFAAMPSLHVGWAVLIAYVVARTGPRWLAILAAGHAVATTLIVIVTANHWWLDAIVGVLLLAIAEAILFCLGRRARRGRALSDVRSPAAEASASPETGTCKRREHRRGAERAA